MVHMPLSKSKRKYMKKLILGFSKIWTSSSGLVIILYFNRHQSRQTITSASISADETIAFGFIICGVVRGGGGVT